MAPDLDYALTEDSFKRYETLLAEVGIITVPAGRTSGEDLPDDTSLWLTTHGLLRYAGREFHYSVHRDYSVERGDFRYRINVWVFQHGFDLAEPLRAALERAFPQKHDNHTA